ncbi:MAG: response regulator [Rikenellaceae bacterium]
MKGPNYVLAVLVAFIATICPLAAAVVAPSANALRYIQVGVDEGFTQNSIHNILQGSDGFLLFSTPNGLFRFDGYEYERLENIVGNENSLAYNYTVEAKEDGEGRLWVLNPQALNCYDAKQRRYDRYLSSSFDSLNLKEFYLDVDRDDHIWFRTIDNVGIITIDHQTKSIDNVIYPLVALGRDESVVTRWMRYTNDGTIWCATDRGLYAITRSEDGAINTIFCGNDRIYSSVDSREGRGIYVVGSMEIRYLWIEGGSLHSNRVCDLSPYINTQHTHDKLCVAPGGGVWYIGWGDVDGRCLMVEFTDEFEYEDSYLLMGGEQLTSFPLGSAIIDESGVLWLGTWSSGLYRVNLLQKRFYTIDPFNHRRAVNSVTGDNRGNLWYAEHNSGICYLNLNSGDHGTIKMSGRVTMVVYYEDALWVACGGKIIRFEVDSRGSVGRSDIINKDTLLADNLSHYIDADGRLWLGSFSDQKVHYIDTKLGRAGSVEELVMVDGSPLDVVQGRVSAVMVDSDSQLWFSILGAGIYRAKLSGDRVESMMQIAVGDDLEDLNRNGAFQFLEDGDRRLWITTFGSGLVTMHLDELDNEPRRYSAGDGLSDNVTYAVVQDGDGVLWISTDNGISSFDPSIQSFKNYGINDGVQSVNFRKWSVWSDSSGCVYYGGMQGITTFDPKEIVENSFAPILHINRVSVNEAEVSMGDSDTLTLPPTSNNIAFEFAAIQLDAPEQIQYYYMLKGVDENWRHTPANMRFASYSNLTAGDYTFVVSAVSRDGVKCSEDVTYSFVISPFWYHTWWATTIYILIILGLITLWTKFQRYRVRIRGEVENERIKRESLEQLNQAKIDFYTNISHEIKTPLTIIKGIIDSVVGSGRYSIEGRNFNVVTRNITRMLQLVIQLLDFRRAVSGNLPFNPVTADMAIFLREMVEPFDGYAAQRGMSFSYSSDCDELRMDFDPDKVHKIVSNLLSNAFKYNSAEGAVAVSLYEGMPHLLGEETIDPAHSYITISVSDSGEGISEVDMENIFKRFFQIDSQLALTDTNAGVGVGLSYTKLLVELHGGAIYVRSRVGEGSTFYVVMPTRQEGVVKVVDTLRSEEMILQTLESTALNIDEESHPSAIVTNAVAGEHDKRFFDSEILIVEDNSEIRQFVKEFLSPNYKVLEAENGVQGLEVATQHLPDLVISDVMMPLMDGLEMTHQLKTNEVTNHIPVIMLTVNDHIDNRIDGLKSGADSYITKPFNVEHLKVRIERLLDMRRTLKDKYVELSGNRKLSDIDINAADKEFISRLESIIEQNLSNPNFSIEEIEPLLDYSRMQLYRKLKSITGLSIVEFVRNYRLSRAVELMHTTQLQISEILYDVGFTTPSYFSKCFKARYGVTPKEFLGRIRE